MNMGLSRIAAAAALTLALGLFGATPVFADATLFAGAAFTPSPARPVTGVAVSMSLLVVGLEVEVARSPEDLKEDTPSLSEGSASVLVQTPTGRVKLYGLLGAGIYRERLGGETLDTNTLLQAGGGIKVGLVGPLGVRVDYRVQTLNGRTTDKYRHRLYGGLLLAF
jgi:hypothetical protein